MRGVLLKELFDCFFGLKSYSVLNGVRKLVGNPFSMGSCSIFPVPPQFHSLFGIVHLFF